MGKIDHDSMRRRLVRWMLHMLKEMNNATCKQVGGSSLIHFYKRILYNETCYAEMLLHVAISQPLFFLHRCNILKMVHGQQFSLFENKAATSLASQNLM